MNEDVEPLAPELEALAMKALETKVVAQIKLTKAEFSSKYPDGRKETFRSPLDGLKVGQVWRTDPDPEWRITDRAALLEHLEEFPGNVVERLVIVGDEAEVLAVLDQYAPHLLDTVTSVPDEVIQAALDQSRATGEAAAPGISMVKPGGVLTIKPDKDAALAIEGLVRTGLLRWDGTRALPAAERKAS